MDYEVTCMHLERDTKQTFQIMKAGVPGKYSGFPTGELVIYTARPRSLARTTPAANCLEGHL